MKAIKVFMFGKSFLFPDGFDFVFPDLILMHADTIEQYIKSSDEFVEMCSNFNNPELENLQKRNQILKNELNEFKARTGIIGFPFDVKDVDLYIATNNIDVVSIIEL